MKNEINDKLLDILKELDEGQLDIEGKDMAGIHLTEDLGLDSLDAIKFLMLVEEKLGVTIPDEDVDDKDLFNIDNLEKYLSEQLK